MAERDDEGRSKNHREDIKLVQFRWPLGVPVQAEQLSARLHLPQADGGALPAADQPRPIRAERNLEDTSGVRFDGLNHFELSRLIEAIETNQPGLTRGSEQGALRMERQRSAVPILPSDHLDALAGSNLPDAQVADVITWAGGF